MAPVRYGQHLLYMTALLIAFLAIWISHEKLELLNLTQVVIPVKGSD